MELKMTIEEFFSPVIRPLTQKEFMGAEKGEDFIPHTKNQPVSAPARSGKQGATNPKSRLAKGV